MDREEFIIKVADLNIELSDHQLTLLDQYYHLLIEWNDKINLTSITEEKQVYLKHFYDSICLVKAVDLDKETLLCDIGTGAGFPGLVLKILFPELHVTLVDSTNKKIVFLHEVIKQLQLFKIDVIFARAEEFSIKNREKYDVVTARAVAPLNILCEYCIPLVKINKYFIPMKANIENEMENIDITLEKLDSKIIDIVDFELPIEQSKRTILKIQKHKKTDQLFPRKYSEMKKKPL